MKATKKIVGAACALIAAVALSAGSTFAWFTANSQVSIGNVTADVVTKGGDLQISLVTPNASGATPTYSYDGWKSSISSAEVQAKLPNDLKLDHVTTDGNDGKTMKTIEGDAITDTTNPSTHNYVEFTFALRSTTAMDIYLVGGTTLTSEVKTVSGATAITPVSCWGDVAANTYGKNQNTDWTAESQISAKAQCASRVSFEDVNDNATKVWAPWETKENGGNDLTKAELEAKDPAVIANYGYYTTYESGDDATKVETMGKNLAGDVARQGGKGAAYFGATTAYTNKISPAAGTTITRGTPADATEVAVADAAGSKLCTLTAGQPKVITVRMWIEGNDGDCLNSIFDQTITMSFAFFGLDPEVPAPTGP